MVRLSNATDIAPFKISNLIMTGRKLQSVILPPKAVSMKTYIKISPDKNTRTRCEICSKLTINARYFKPYFSFFFFFFVNFEHLVAGWVCKQRTRF